MTRLAALVEHLPLDSATNVAKSRGGGWTQERELQAATLETQLVQTRLLAILLIAMGVKQSVVSDALDAPRYEHPDRPKPAAEEPVRVAQPASALAAFIAKHGD